jgi:hypothetical protein
LAAARPLKSRKSVISKDGGVRVFMRVRKELIMWDNVMTHQTPMSQKEIQSGEDVLREILEEREAFDREHEKSEPASSSNRISKELERIVMREYPRLFRTPFK